MKNEQYLVFILFAFVFNFLLIILFIHQNNEGTQSLLLSTYYHQFNSMSKFS